MDYSGSKRVRVTPDIVEYSDESPPMYDLILGKQSLHDLGVILDFKEKTITIDECWEVVPPPASDFPNNVCRFIQNSLPIPGI